MHPIVLDALEREFQTGKPLNSDNLKTIANDAVNTENEKRSKNPKGLRPLSQRQVPERGKLFQWARAHPSIVKVQDSYGQKSVFEWQGA